MIITPILIQMAGVGCTFVCILPNLVPDTMICTIKAPRLGDKPTYGACFHTKYPDSSNLCIGMLRKRKCSLTEKFIQWKKDKNCEIRLLMKDFI
ncbi:hypothetical protein QD47_13820 [Paenibacillus terrae]|uniref:Uncharacterized protein n=1 Tax=Paenibacillus terrae TaxID=159743 RepID=A0A0D7X271_9BACL|nr:hypothetical protein QD47_13820 [Paenibacillus terrae]